MIFLRKDDMIIVGDNMTRKNSASYYFEQILEVPRPSGKEEKIAGFLVHFAQLHNLEYEVDDYSNVIIKKKGTLPYKCKPIILQAHTDMVCTSNEFYDFDNRGIEWYLEDGFYKAKRSSLGADDGVGVAIILALLSDNSLEHPPIEAIFTTQEETTMNGAKNLNYKKIKGKRLISLDGTEEEKIEVSCAGMASIKVSTPYELVPSTKNSYQLTISGLLGGHSGVDIDAHRGNSIKILANMLKDIDDIEIVSISAGSKENVIPSSAKCIFNTNHDFSADFQFFKTFYQEEYETIKLDFRRMKAREIAIDNQKSLDIIGFLNKIEDGVLKRNDVDFPLTSSNLGVITQDEEKILIELSIRSSIVGFEDFYVSRAERVAKKYHLKYFLEDKKPFFTFREDSPLRQLLVDTYQNMFSKNITLEDVHAGLEGGIFAQEIKDLDICVIGANLYDIHSVNEKVEKESMERVLSWLKEVLRNMQ